MTIACILALVGLLLEVGKLDKSSKSLGLDLFFVNDFVTENFEPYAGNVNLLDCSDGMDYRSGILDWIMHHGASGVYNNYVVLV